LSVHFASDVNARAKVSAIVGAGGSEELLSTIRFRTDDILSRVVCLEMFLKNCPREPHLIGLEAIRISSVF